MKPTMGADRMGTTPDAPVLQDDFLERLETSLVHAEHDRVRHDALRRARALLPLALLVGPLVAWRLTFVSGGSVHVLIEAVTWLTFFLDVGVHVNTTVLTFLGLQVLPTLVGLLLLVLVTFGLLTSRADKG